MIKLGPSYAILEKLAVNPIGLRRSHGKTWEEIEKDLAVKVDVEDQFNTLISEYIDLRLISNCNNMDDWSEKVTLTIEEDETVDTGLKKAMLVNIKQFIQSKQDFGEVVWSKTIGAPILL